MYICVYIYICVCIYIHTSFGFGCQNRVDALYFQCNIGSGGAYIYTFSYTHIYIYIHTYIHTYIYICFRCLNICEIFLMQPEGFGSMTFITRPMTSLPSWCKRLRPAQWKRRPCAEQCGRWPSVTGLRVIATLRFALGNEVNEVPSRKK